MLFLVDRATLPRMQGAMNESPRTKAAMEGQTKYEGKPCKVCGGTLRWIINCTCVSCSNARTAEGVRKRRQLLRDLMKGGRSA